MEHEDHNQSPNFSNLAKIKESFLTDLDDFLVDQGASWEKRQKALEKLDRLIQADLGQASYFLTKQKSEFKAEIEPRPIPQIVKKIQAAHHVLDLKHPPLKVVKKKKFVWRNKEIFDRAEDDGFSWADVKTPLFKISKQLVVFVFIILLVLLPVKALVFWQNILQDKAEIWKLGKNGLFNLQSGVLSASVNDLQTSETDFQAALANFSAIQEVLGKYQDWMIEAGAKMPIVGKSVSVGTNLLNIANDVSRAAVTLNQQFQNNENVTNHLLFLSGQIDQTLPYLEAASKDIKKIDLDSLDPEIQGYFKELADYLPKATVSLKNIKDVFAVFGEVLGHTQEKRYLVLFQNNNELRATGGFIGSMALIDIYHGKITNLEIPKGGTYDLAAGQTVKLKSPRALSLINPYFNLWDANWWPDFPTSAKKISWMYQNFGGATTDGVIAVNADLLGELLKVTGDMPMPEYNVTITSDNLFTTLQNQVELNYDKITNEPKAIIADLAPKLLEKLLDNKDKQKEVVKVLVDALANKDIQLYLSDADLQAKVKKFSWAGEMLTASKDYLEVVNTNIAGGKTDKDIYQTIEHQAEIMSNGEIIDTVKVTRTNKGEANNPLAGINSGNASYLRFYVPAGSELVFASGFDRFNSDAFQTQTDAQDDQDIQAEEKNKFFASDSQTEIYTSLNKTVFANWMTLKPGETKTVALKYKLPFKIKVSDNLVNNWWHKIFKGDVILDNYSLLLQSQAGVKNTVFNSSVLLPDNLKVVWGKALDQKKMSINNKLVSYGDDLIQDQYFGFIMTNK